MKKKSLIILMLLIFVLFGFSFITQESVVKERTTNFFREYDQYLEISEKAYLIPALKEEFIPQGMAYVTEKDWIVISYYQAKGPSILTILDAATGQLVKGLKILNEDGTEYTGHAGGVAISKSNLWISSGGFIRRIPLATIFSVSDGDEIRIIDRYNAGTKASFIKHDKGVLWIGEFFHANNYLTDRSHYVKRDDGYTNHSWMVGLKLDDKTDLPVMANEEEQIPLTPDYIISIPDIVQGVTFSEDSNICLSLSYGRTNDSRLLIFEDVLSKNPDMTVSVNQQDIPLWVLTLQNQICEFKALPMSEGILIKDGLLYILYESAAKKYLITTKYATDYVWKVPFNALCPTQ
jgi:hypothetical protein